MKLNPIQQEMLQMATEAKNMSATDSALPVTGNFNQLLNNAINQVNQLQKNSSELATSFDRGDRNLSLSDVMIARNKSSVAFEATVQVRNRLIEAYKELINMPV